MVGCASRWRRVSCSGSSSSVLYVAQSFEIEFREFHSPAPYTLPCRRIQQEFLGVQARIGGKSAWLIVDTGSLTSGLTKAGWKRFGLPNTAQARVAFQAGLFSSQVELAQLPPEVSQNLVEMRSEVDGILGLDLLRECALGLDLPNGIVALFPPETSFGMRLKLWFDSMTVIVKGMPAWVPLCSTPCLLRGNVLTPLPESPRPSSGVHLVDSFGLGGYVGLPLTVSSLSLDGILDTGTSITTLPGALRSQVELGREVHGLSARGLVPAALGGVASIETCGFRLSPPHGASVRLPSNEARLGVVGLDLLSSSKVLMDFRDGKIGLAPYLRSAEDESHRYYSATVFDPREARTLHFQGKARYAVREGSIVVTGHSRVRPVSTKNGFVTIDVS